MAEVQKPVIVMMRHEMKYILTPTQKDFVFERIKDHMRPDRHGRSSIASLYYDTPDYRLIRASVEKPVFKEKIRVRSYGQATDESPVFLEVKRKVNGIVFKRRVQSTIPCVNDFFDRRDALAEGGQIAREMVYFRDYYKDLSPACLIIYERTSFEGEDDLRLTVDESPRYRLERLDLRDPLDGIPLLEDGLSVLEIKVRQVVPLWLSSVLAEGGIYRESFSKYGTAYAILVNYPPLRL